MTAQGPEVAVLILCTVPTGEAAAALARTLIEERLAACVQAAPITSWYRWQGSIEQASEQRLHIKTTAALAERVIARIAALHAYAVPEIVTVPIAGGAAAYLDWIAESVAPA